MAKVADVKLSWVRSVSTDVSSRQITVVINGDTQVYNLGPEVDSFMVEVRAMGTVSFSTAVKDSEGQVTSSTTVTTTLGDLEAPQPDTGLTFQVVGVRDVDDTPVVG